MIERLVAVAAAAVRFVNDEAEHLALLDVVKADDADVAIAERIAAFVDFAQHFLHAPCVKQRQLPHRPEVLGWLRSFVKFYSGNVALIEDVLNLPGDLLIIERRQIRQRFVAAFFTERLHGF